MLEILAISGGMALAVLIVAGVFGYAGFWMGRQVADKPIAMPGRPWATSSGQPVLDEYDAYDEALRSPGLDADMKKEAGK